MHTRKHQFRLEGLSGDMLFLLAFHLRVVLLLYLEKCFPASSTKEHIA